MVIQWVCNSVVGLFSPPTPIFIFVINGHCIGSWFYLSLKIRMFPAIIPWVDLFYFIFALLIDVSRDSVCPEYKCLPSVFRDSQNPSLWFSHVSGLTVQRGRDALAGFCWGWEQSPLGPRLSASPWLCVPNKCVSISACNSHVMFFHRKFFPLFDSCQKDLEEQNQKNLKKFEVK